MQRKYHSPNSLKAIKLLSRGGLWSAATEPACEKGASKTIVDTAKINKHVVLVVTL